MYSIPSEFHQHSLFYISIARGNDKEENMLKLLLRILLLSQAARTTVVVGSQNIDEETKNALRGKIRAAQLQQPMHVERVVDHDEIEQFEREGKDPTHPNAALDPPGHEANVDEYPFFAYWHGPVCGATVVHDDILLTAAHCVHAVRDPNESRSVKLRRKFRHSENDKHKEDKEDGIVRAIAHMEMYPSFDFGKAGAPAHDYALLKVDRSVLVKDDDVDEDSNDSVSKDDTFNETATTATGVEIVKLNRDLNYPATGATLHSAGFGKYLHNSTASKLSEILLDVELEALPDDLCTKHYGQKFDGDVMLCAGSWDGKRDTCNGKNSVVLKWSHLAVPKAV